MARDKDLASLALTQLQTDLEGLKRAFARYFEGLERAAPLEARDKFKAEVLRTAPLLRGNTGLMFRYNTLKASLLSQETLWNRTMAQIEAGTYPPHRLRAKAIGAGPTAPPAPASAAVAAKPAAPHPLAKLHAAYAAFAGQSGHKTPSIEALAAVVAHKVAEVRQQSGGRQVQVSVVLENNAPVLKVVAKQA